MIMIQQMQSADISDIVQMAQVLYREDDVEMLRQEFEEMLTSEKDEVFVANEDKKHIGFIHMALRYEYVEGAASSPVAYMEGIYVNPEFRHQHIARKLALAGEEWAKSKGCSQMASDAEFDNSISHAFHQKIGFKEVNRLVCYIKEIES